MPAPRKKSAASFELPSSTATRSPGLSPSPSRALANLQPRSQACAKVSRLLPWTTASRSAKKTAARRIAVVTSMTSSRPFDQSISPFNLLHHGTDWLLSGDPRAARTDPCLHPDQAQWHIREAHLLWLAPAVCDLSVDVRPRATLP